jgi:hypothetical protein
MSPESRQYPAGIEDQLWPIVCATAVLVGVLAAVVYVNGDFDDERLLFNGYTQLAAVSVVGAAIVFLGSKVRGRARRTAELAILLSLALHAIVGLSAVYLFESKMAAPGYRSEWQDAALAAFDEAPPADYHWGRNDDEDEPQQAFEKPVETDVRDQAVAAATVKPRDLDRPVPANEVPRAAKPELAPMGVAAAQPIKPLDVLRPAAAKVEDLPPPDALAMVRPKDRETAMPEAPAPAPVAMPEAPKEPARSIEPQAVQHVKAEKYLWAKVAAKSVDPNEAAAPPRKLFRDDATSSDELPSREIVVRVPSQAPPRTSTENSGAEAADSITRRGSTPVRNDRGAAMPSAIVSDAGSAALLPAAEGSSPGGAVEHQSNVAVEGTNNSHAPLGPNIASAGNQEFARGASPLPTRRGAIDGRGRAEPSLVGDADSDLDELRAGSPGSSREFGLAQPAAPARRAIAAQTEDDGADRTAGPTAGLPRSASQLGVPLPSATINADDSNSPGGGGASARQGGRTSGMEVGQNISVQRVAGSGTLSGVARGGALSRSGAGDAPLNTVASVSGVASGLGAGPRRVEQGESAGDDGGAGDMPRRRAAVFAPRTQIDPVGTVSGTASAVQGAGPTGFGGQAIGPHDSLGGTGRLYGPGQRIGARPAGTAEPADIDSSAGLASLQHSGITGARRPGDSQLDDVLSGDAARGGGRSRGEVVLNSTIHEPLDPFRHDRRGPALGDGANGQLTEPAIENGLAFFARSQFPDGHWSLHDPPPGVLSDPASSTGRKQVEADTAATGLALLAYMAAGYTHQDEKYRQTVQRGIQWLVKHQADDGNLSYHRDDPSYDRGSDPTHFYSQGIATMALCEAYGMTQDRDLRGPAQKAIDFIVRAQDPVRGGWRYVATQGSDTSVTGWQLMALKSAQMAGLSVPDENMRKIGHWLDLAQVSGGRYVYNPWNLDTDEERKGRNASPTMTAQAMIMRMYLGQDKDPGVLRQGADYIQEHLPQAAGGARPDCYYWYYATQAMYHMQGDYWQAWDDRVTPLLRAGQVEKGPFKGSWSAAGPSPDEWGDVAGRHYVTAMRILTLEFRYWHLPLFRELRRD